MSARVGLSDHYLCDEISFLLWLVVATTFSASPCPRKLQRPCAKSRAQDATSTVLCLRTDLSTLNVIEHTHAYDSSLEF